MTKGNKYAPPTFKVLFKMKIDHNLRQLDTLIPHFRSYGINSLMYYDRGIRFMRLNHWFILQWFLMWLFGNVSNVLYNFWKCVEIDKTNVTNIKRMPKDDLLLYASIFREKLPNKHGWLSIFLQFLHSKKDVYILSFLLKQVFP